MNKFIEILKTIKFKIINGMFFRRKNKIILDKNNNYNNITVKFSNMLIKSINHKHIEEMSEHIKEFLNVMTRDCRNFASEILLQNFKITFFDISKIKKIDNGIGGEVNASMSFYPFLGIHKIKNIKYTIDNFSVSKHELLHLSTLEGDACGFYQTNKNNLAEGLNESYTQLLSERYFYENIGEAYFYETFFCGILEKIVGKEKMEKFYFEVSLASLINELQQYENNENIMTFIKNMDLLLNLKLFNNTLNLTLENFNKCQNIVNELCEFLLSIFKRKIDLISLEQTKSESEVYLHLLVDSIFKEKTIIRFNHNNKMKEHIINLFDKNKVKELHKYIDEKFYYHDNNITKNSIK